MCLEAASLGLAGWPMAALADNAVTRAEIHERFGIPSDRWGETPCAHLTIDDTIAVSEDDLIQLCVDRLGSYKKPGKVVLSTEPLPKSPVGKILRRSLREPYWAGQDRRVSGS